ncbi:MAG: hypothetical protein EOM40_18495, partial [Clostridia bacterium]|nr:hypothetical protein [Clostridia bacterium]
NTVFSFFSKIGQIGTLEEVISFEITFCGNSRKIDRLSNHGTGNAIEIVGPGIDTAETTREQLLSCFLSEQSGRQSYGNTDLGSTENALTFSDGTNSGIAISNVGAAGDTISFDVSFADYNSAELWDSLGTDTLTKDSVSEISLAQDQAGNPYIGFVKDGDGKAYVQKYDGSKWVTLGAAASFSGASTIQLLMYQDVPYLLYHDDSANYNIHVSCYKGGKWNDITGTLGGKNPQYFYGTSGSDGIYLSCGSGSFDSGYTFNLIKYDGSTYSVLSDKIASGTYSDGLLAASGQKIYWASRNYSKNQIDTKVFDVSSGTQTDLTGTMPGTGVRIGADSSGVYLITGDGSNGVRAYSLNGTTWTQMGNALSGNQTIFYDITAKDGRICATTNVSDGSSKNIVNWTWSQGSWQQVGSSVASEEASALETVANGNEIYTAYTVTVGESNDQITVRHKTTEIPPVPTVSPTATPTPKPTVSPTATPTPKPTVSPTTTPKPTVSPTATVTPKPTAVPTAKPTQKPTPTSTVKNGFITEGQRKYYYVNGARQKGWKLVNNKWYYMDSTGAVMTGWLQSGKTWYYLNWDGAMATGWVSTGGHKYFMYGSGAMATGWIQTGGRWYYLNSSGAMATGWLKDGGTWYYLNADGAMATGWVQTGGSRYYMRSSGAMAIGWIQTGGRWYYLNSSGAMATGWLKDGGTWYYLNADGAMATGWVQIGGSRYYMRSSGAMAIGWVQTGGHWYYMNGSGAMATGWIKSGTIWYYLYADGVMAANTWIGNYYVDGSEAWVQSR